MTWAKHWDIRRHIKEFRELTDDDRTNKGVEARYTILDYLILRANSRLRTYVSVEIIMADTGYRASEAVAGAIKWLFDRGAIYNVPPRHRVGQEAELHNRKYVFQLTGVINLGGRWLRYLAFSPEDAEIMIEEWQRIGMELAVDMEFLLSPPGTTIKVQSSSDEDRISGQGSSDEGSLNEGSSDRGQSSTSSESLSSTSPSSSTKDSVSPDSSVDTPADEQDAPLPETDSEYLGLDEELSDYDQMSDGLKAAAIGERPESPQVEGSKAYNRRLWRAMELAIIAATKSYSEGLTDPQIRQLNSRYDGYPYRGERVDIPAPTNLYDADPDFQKFVTERITVQSKFAKCPSRSNIIKDILHFDRPQSGWLDWRKAHGQEEMVIVSTEAPDESSIDWGYDE